MARFQGIQVETRDREIELKFRLDAPAVVGWQLCDPSTGAYLFEGEWSEAQEAGVDMRVQLPETGKGPQCVEVVVENRDLQ